ncbi:MAG: FMN-binding negative transcriptional regulator [Proteobacteria bacterium]|nr:FMN-binding negative transcriptional regulator [Pseudomonadota bacterium]
MYNPAHFDESRAEVLHAFIEQHPLATVVGATPKGILANHIPLLREDGGGAGVLKGHIARANPMWQDVPAGSEVLAIFQGPSRYISPNWYPSKREHGRVVPTWNYAVVHARGAIAWHRDEDWLRNLVATLTDRHERGQAAPWKVGDAPEAFVQQMLAAIVGFEISVTSLVGKWKLSQNRSPAERAGVIDALAALPDAASREMAALVGRAGKQG